MDALLEGTSSPSPKIKIFLPGAHLETTGSQDGGEMGDWVLNKAHRKRTQANTQRQKRKSRHRSLVDTSEEGLYRSTSSSKTSKLNHNDAYMNHHPLQDYLHPGLDVVFCGINPGRMSAETGHHFANPTNHFWRCLHRSGMTNYLVSPFEDFVLPGKFNIGLTNLVDRPSAQARELSRAEMIASVPAFLDKLARHRPRFVCFVGVAIWEVVRDSLMKLAQRGVMTRMEKGKSKGKSQMGLQSYKLVYGNSTKADSPRETLLFVVPCTSGRVVRYQLPDKIALFKELQTLVKMTSSEIGASETENIICLP